MPIRLMLAGFLALSVTTVSAQNWPSFRGASRGVVSDDPKLPDTWGVSENVAWKVTVPGLGWGSPVVWGDHVFVTSAIGDDPIPKPGLVIEDGKMPSTPTYRQIPANGSYRWVLYDFDFRTELTSGGSAQ